MRRVEWSNPRRKPSSSSWQTKSRPRKRRFRKKQMKRTTSWTNTLWESKKKNTTVRKRKRTEAQTTTSFSDQSLTLLLSKTKKTIWLWTLLHRLLLHLYLPLRHLLFKSPLWRNESLHLLLPHLLPALMPFSRHHTW